MKSFCTAALVVCAGLGLAVPRAAAQYGASGLLPLPPVTAVDAVTASYHLPAGGMDPYGSMFTGRASEQVPQPPDGSLIDGANGTSAFEDAVYSGWNDCVTCGDECGAPRGGWFGALGGLVMGRNRANPFWTTYETNNNPNQLLNTQNAVVDWTGGWEITTGYMFGGCGDGCGMPAIPWLGCGGCGAGPGIAFTYWGLGQMNGFAGLTSLANELSTPMDLNGQFGSIDINGVPVADYWDNSRSHRIYRNDRVNNFELNLLLGAWSTGRWTVVPFAGFRYFRFDERLTFMGLAFDGSWDDPDDWAALSNRMVNNLYGAQVGTFANYMFHDRVGWYLGPKVGLFGNQMNGRTLLYDGQGNVEYDIAAHKSDFSMLAEVTTGFTYFFRPNLFGYLGYRVVGISNIALSDNQYLHYLADEQGFTEVKENGSLILHGAMFGGGWMF